MRVLPALIALCALAFSSSLAAATDSQNLSDRSDAALTAMASNWDALDAATRRGLLKEVQRRMSLARQQRRSSRSASAAQGTLQIRTERRFGRRVRQADGSVVTIETRVVQLRKRPNADGQAEIAAESSNPVVSQSPAPAPVVEERGQRVVGPFGVGFEQRSAARRYIVVPRSEIAPEATVKPQTHGHPVPPSE